MLTFLLLFIIIFASVGIVAYLYLSESYTKWIVSMVFCFALIAVFVYSRQIVIGNYTELKDSGSKLTYFRKESLSVVSYWCTAIITGMTLISLPKTISKLKENKLPVFSIVLFLTILVMVWNL